MLFVAAFGIGAITDFRTVELFCLYTGLSILFCYLYCITFFAAAMTFSGWREHDNRHCFALVKVAPLEESSKYTQIFEQYIHSRYGIMKIFSILSVYLKINNVGECYM